MATIDIIVLTHNEEKHITDCLNSFQGLGQAVVVDDNSQDATVALAEAAGAIVYSRTLDNFADQRNFALTKTSADWVFFLDADERFTPELLEGVRRVVDRGPQVGSVRRINYAFGRQHRFGPLAPEWTNRLFPNGSVHWVGLVHERPESILPVVRIDGTLRHYTYSDWPSFLHKISMYMRLAAEDEYKNGRNTSVFKGCFYTAYAFFRVFIIKLGILEGPVGWALSWYAGTCELTKYMLLYQKNIDDMAGDARGGDGDKA